MGKETRLTRATLVGYIADQLPEVGRPLLVAIDGPDAAGKTTLADEVADALRARGRDAVRSGIDWFHHPAAHRHALGRTPRTVWERTFDTARVRREVLDPWLAGPGSMFVPRWWDVAADAPVDADPVAVPVAGVLVFDGVFVQKPEFVNAWDLVVFVDADETERVHRMAVRDGTPDDPTHPDQVRYLEAQRAYQDLLDPRGSADLLIDNTDIDAPTLRSVSGWVREGDWLTRQIRVPARRLDLVSRIEDLLAGGESAH